MKGMKTSVWQKFMERGLDREYEDLCLAKIHEERS